MQLFAFGTTWRCAEYIKISNILIQFFVFGTTWRCADFRKISNESDQQCCQQNSSKLQILCPPYLKNALSQLNFFFVFHPNII
ncbi:hypothetical protein O3M35_006616 [Rhynocoris fuscipes]|uniref:Uncharacterized protein n=1 Tax=Rhynocoris fuscipes TaxID=488301 RepID=A0AAW1DGP7_9HEMI